MPKEIDFTTILEAIADSWNEVAPSLLNRSVVVELTNSQMISASSALVNDFATWSTILATTSQGAVTGIFIHLFHSTDIAKLSELARQNSASLASEKLLDNILAAAASQLDSRSSSLQATKLLETARLGNQWSTLLGEQIYIGDLTIYIDTDISLSSMVIYAPMGKLLPIPIPIPIPTKANNETKNLNNSELPKHSSKALPKNGSSNTIKPQNIGRLLSVELDVVVRFGLAKMALADLVRMGAGSMIELNRAIDEPVELLVNGQPLARGEVVVIDGYYGVHITEILIPKERAFADLNLGGSYV